MLKLPNLQRDVKLAPFTTYQIGGPADYFVEVHGSHELAEAVRTARSAKVPYFVLGTGANILVTDKGFRGLVIRNRADAVKVAGHKLTAESGATVAATIEQRQLRTRLQFANGVLILHFPRLLCFFVLL